MMLVIIVGCFALIMETSAQIPDSCLFDETNRPPENSDLNVKCETMDMEVSIYLCPVYNAQYNESLMVLNNQVQISECYGTPNWTASPPVLTFKFLLNGSSFTKCQHDFKMTYSVGTGVFSQYSNVPHANISGTISSVDPSAGQITFREQVIYKYSCSYPLQYLLDNTELAVSGVKLAIKDSNGTFITTLRMTLYSGSDYTTPLSIPPNGLDLKTKVYVAVKATKLTERFHLLLARCYATTDPDPASAQAYNLFVGCPSDSQTKIEINGKSQVAHFSFEAFRFVKHKNLTVSTFYLHCTTRLCEAEECSMLTPDCSGLSRRRREAPDEEEEKEEKEEEVPSEATVSSGPITVGKLTTAESQLSSAGDDSTRESYSGPVVAVIVCVGILAIFLTALAACLVVYMRRKKRSIS